MSATAKTAIEAQLLQLIASPINPDRSLTGKQLWTVYFWQVVAEVAEKSKKASWEAIQGAGGLVDADDKLRALSAGEHIAAESNKYTVMVKLSEPRKTFNLEAFIEKAARRYRIPKDKLTELAEACRTEGKPALTKRIIEAE